MKIDIIGRGNVGSHLYEALKPKADVVSVNPRTLQELRSDADLFLISVSDDAIKEVVKSVRHRISPESIVAHTSGTTPLSAIQGEISHSGVFYPLQTFTKGVTINYEEIPFFIEGNDRETEIKLIDTAALISANVHKANSAKRRDLHIASVFCCNFCNHLWAMADNWLENKGLDFKTLVPLIKETSRKATERHPFELQTGPAVRHDRGILDSHLQALDTEPELQDIYSLLSLSIMNHHPLNNGNNIKKK